MIFSCRISPYSGILYAAKSGMNAPTKLLLTVTAAAALSFVQPAQAAQITGEIHFGGDAIF
jgi:hypothetical protein